MRKKLLEKIKLVLLTTTLFWAMFPVQCFAIGESSLVKGTTKLINDATTVIITLSSIVTAVMVVYNLVRQQACDEEDKIKYKKNVKGILIIGVIVVVVPSLVKIILAYYT